MSLRSLAANPPPDLCGTPSGETTLEYVLTEVHDTDTIDFEPTKQLSMLKNSSWAGRPFPLYIYDEGIEQQSVSLGTADAKGRPEVQVASH
jgi:hypothetical protein